MFDVIEKEELKLQKYNEKQKKVVLSSISSDSHTWNLIFMQLYLEKLGCEVINLGACCEDERVMAAIHHHEPDFVVISSVNGHAHIDGARLIQKLRADDVLKDIPVIIGGKLGVSGKNNKQYVNYLADAGFDAVFDDSGDILNFENYVKNLIPYSNLSDLN